MLKWLILLLFLNAENACVGSHAGDELRKLLAIEKSIDELCLRFVVIQERLLHVVEELSFAVIPLNDQYCELLLPQSVINGSLKLVFDLMVPIPVGHCLADNDVCVAENEAGFYDLRAYFFLDYYQENFLLKQNISLIFIEPLTCDTYPSNANRTDICLASEYSMLPDIEGEKREECCEVNLNKDQCYSFENTTIETVEYELDRSLMNNSRLIAKPKTDYYLKYLKNNAYCPVKDDSVVIMRRFNGLTDFYRSWNEYETGFGDVSSEFWIGNDKLHLLTWTSKFGLWVDLENWNSSKAYAFYRNFTIENSTSGYRLHVSDYEGTAGDSLSAHNECKFSTYDVDNDEAPESLWEGSCAKRFHSGWWFKSCYRSNLNGKYYPSEKVDAKMNDGISWNTWSGHKYSLKSVQMKLIKINV